MRIPNTTKDGCANDSRSFALTSRDAQVIIMTVTAIGGVMLGATTIAGLLMLYQIRQATDLERSAKAIYAADTGIEWAFYDFQCNLAYPADPSPCHQKPPGNSSVDASPGTPPFFDLDGDGNSDPGPLDVAYRVKDFEGADPTGDFSYDISEDTRKIISTGTAGQTGRASSRAFELQLR